MPDDPEILDKLHDLLAAIRKHPDPRRATAEWKQAFNLLKKTDAEANRVANIVVMRGVDRLAELLEELRLAEQPQAAPEGPGETADTEAPDDVTCKMALRAFKKRLKLTRLDDESQLDVRDPLSKGHASHITAIQPPGEWPAAVWRELVRRGKLRHAGRGFYELAEE